jgi:DNA-binding transcriptional LysR family regulator
MLVIVVKCLPLTKVPAMKNHQLRALVAVADYGSIQRAAQALHLSQPAVTKALHDLEREVGVAVIARTPKGAHVNEYGQSLLKHARMIEQQLRHAREEIDALTGARSGKLMIGATPVACIGPLAGAIVNFQRRQPDIDMKILELRPSQILEALNNGTIDFGLISRVGIPQAAPFYWETMYEVDLTLSVRKGHPLKTARLADLRDSSWLVWDPSEEPGNMLYEIFAHHGLPPPTRVVRCTSASLYSMLLTNTDMIGCLADTAYDFTVFGHVLHPLTLNEVLPKLSVGLVCQDSDLLTSVAADFINEIRLICQTSPR